MRWRWLVAGVLGLLLAGPLTVEHIRADDEEEYARIELKGRVRRLVFPPSRIPVIDVGRQTYDLEIKRGNAALTPKDLERVDGEVVIIRGTLILRRDNPRPLVVVTSISKPGKGD